MSAHSPSFLQCLREEWSALLHDKWLFSLLTWVPVLLFSMFWILFSDGAVRDLPVGVVDLDKSVLSRQFIRAYDATPVIKTEPYYDMTEATSALQRGDIYGLVILPAGLAEDAAKKLQPQVTALVNYEYLLIGKQINSALQRAHATTAVRLDVGQNLASSSPVFQVATAAAMPISVQSTPFANTNSDYGQFLVSAMIPAVWQILVVATIILSLARTQRLTGLGSWLAGGGVVKKMVAKLLPLTVLCWLQGIVFLWFMFCYIGWPMHGSWLILISALSLTVLACQGAGFLFFMVTRDVSRALSITAAYTAPGFAFMGVTFPVTDMNIAARIWRSLLPVSHYSEIQIGQANYGVSLLQTLEPLVFLASFSLLLLLAFVMASRLVARDLSSKGIV